MPKKIDLLDAIPVAPMVAEDLHVDTDRLVFKQNGNEPLLSCGAYLDLYDVLEPNRSLLTCVTLRRILRLLSYIE